MHKRLLSGALLAAMLLVLLAPAVQAETPVGGQKVKLTIQGIGYSDFAFLTDGGIKGYKTSSQECILTLESDEAFGSLYLMFDLEYGEYTITDNDNNLTQTAGQYSFLHEYVELSQPTTSVTITFPNGAVRLSEISAYTYGAIPEGVQVWEPPLDDGADILLLATHGDDDQLFFAGLFPLYAGEKDCRVQVAYLTDHRNLTNVRTHEMLNGLWATGVEAYPVFGDFADFRIDDLQGTYQEYARLGTTKDELQSFVVEQIRRFKPQVIVGHDFNGEYGHGMHMVYTDLLVSALDLTNDETAYPESASEYGLWDVPKTYIHLYKENSITIDYDVPLESFGGLTAFQVTQKYGYPCHESQQYTWFTGWLNGKSNEITAASQIATYNPCEFGLYRSTVGADVLKNDFLENITTYAEQERLEQERLEQEQQQQQQEQEETQPTQQQDPIRQLGQDPSEEEEALPKKNNLPWVITFIVLLMLLLLFLYVKTHTSKGGKYKKKRRRK